MLHQHILVPAGRSYEIRCLQNFPLIDARKSTTDTDVKKKNFKTTIRQTSLLRIPSFLAMTTTAAPYGSATGSKDQWNAEGVGVGVGVGVGE